MLPSQCVLVLPGPKIYISVPLWRRVINILLFCRAPGRAEGWRSESEVPRAEAAAHGRAPDVGSGSWSLDHRHDGPRPLLPLQWDTRGKDWDLQTVGAMFSVVAYSALNRSTKLNWYWFVFASSWMIPWECKPKGHFSRPCFWFLDSSWPLVGQLR